MVLDDKCGFTENICVEEKLLWWKGRSTIIKVSD